MTREQITRDELIARFQAQGVIDHKHYAAKCPICGTVQSMQSLVNAGADPEKVDRYFGFSCEGRLNGAGPYDAEKSNPQKRGCNWSLGGLMQFHELEIDDGGETMHPFFALATAEEAQTLQHQMAMVGVGQ